MKPPPKTPAKTPVIIAPGIVSIVGEVIGVVPNFSTADDIALILSPSKSALNRERLKTAIAQQTKTFQITENFQNVFGFDISYANRAPPIGAPKAADTPADIPAAIK